MRKEWAAVLLYVFLLIDSKILQLVDFITIDLLRNLELPEDDTLKISQIHYLSSSKTLLNAMLSVSLVYMLTTNARVSTILLWNIIGSLTILAAAFPIAPLLDGNASKNSLTRCR